MTDRDFKAHVIQLCDYIEDGWVSPKTLDMDVLYKKAKQVRRFAWGIEQEKETKT